MMSWTSMFKWTTFQEISRNVAHLNILVHDMITYCIIVNLIYCLSKMGFLLRNLFYALFSPKALKQNIPEVNSCWSSSNNLKIYVAQTLLMTYYECLITEILDSSNFWVKKWRSFHLYDHTIRKITIPGKFLKMK